MKYDQAAPDNASRFSVTHPGEVERVLRGVMETRALVTIQVTEGREFLVTTLVALDTGEGALYLGCGDDERKNAVLLGAASVTFFTHHEKIKVQFVSEALQLVMVEGRPLFRVPMPATLLRFQRREYFRLPTSLTNPIKCFIPSPEGNIDAAVIDISVGGIGILAYEHGTPIIAGEIYHGCHLSLPGGAAFLVSLNVRSTYDITLKNGVVSHRAGCQFINLPASVESEIQRYIFRIERDRRYHA